MLSKYRQVLALRAIRTSMLLGILGRIPYFAASVVVTLHVVRAMDRSYAEAGIASAVLVLATAVSGPWRGRLLDRYGMRRVILPSIFVLVGYAAAVPFLAFGPFLLAQAAVGLFYLPLQSILRQAVIAGAPDEHRRTALSLDGLVLELAAGLAPAIGVAAATTWNSGWVLSGVFWASALSGVLLFVVNPPLRRSESSGPEIAERPPFRSWFRPAVAGLLLGAIFTTVVFAGADLAVVATLNEVNRASSIGWVLMFWSVGSVIGAIIYGGIQRQLSPFLLLASLGAVVILPMFASSALMLACLLALTGLLSQPVLTSAVEQIVDRVPATARGEALGWHGTAMTTGLGLGAPVAGAAIDLWGASSGFFTVGVFGVVTGLGLWFAALLYRRRPRVASPTSVKLDVQ